MHTQARHICPRLTESYNHYHSECQPKAIHIGVYMCESAGPNCKLNCTFFFLIFTLCVANFYLASEQLHTDP